MKDIVLKVSYCLIQSSNYLSQTRYQDWLDTNNIKIKIFSIKYVYDLVTLLASRNMNVIEPGAIQVEGWRDPLLVQALPSDSPGDQICVR